MAYKRILTIQDISCVGQCSLTVALPIISACGVECAVMPTAVLSTHTQFQNFTFHDLTEEIKPIVDHWEKEKIDFDAVYTGYLGSFEQIRIVSHVIDALKAIDDDSFTLEFNDDESPIVLKCSIPWIAVVMPIRMK